MTSYTVADKSVATQVVGAVGIAENAFNDGLVRGFLYGERHSPTQVFAVRGKAFMALAKRQRTIGTEHGFTHDDVYPLAAVLLPTADAVLREADRRREARIKRELKESGSVGMKV